MMPNHCLHGLDHHGIDSTFVCSLLSVQQQTDVQRGNSLQLFVCLPAEHLLSTTSCICKVTPPEQDDEELDNGDVAVAQGGVAREQKGLLGPKKEADYDYFVHNIWSAVSTKEEKQIMTAPMVWQVIIESQSLIRLLCSRMSTLSCFNAIGASDNDSASCTNGPHHAAQQAI